MHLFCNCRRSVAMLDKPSGRIYHFITSHLISTEVHFFGLKLVCFVQSSTRHSLDVLEHDTPGEKKTGKLRIWFSSVFLILLTYGKSLWKIMTILLRKSMKKWGLWSIICKEEWKNTLLSPQFKWLWALFILLGDPWGLLWISPAAGWKWWCESVLMLQHTRCSSASLTCAQTVLKTWVPRRRHRRALQRGECMRNAVTGVNRRMNFFWNNLHLSIWSLLGALHYPGLPHPLILGQVQNKPLHLLGSYIRIFQMRKHYLRVSGEDNMLWRNTGFKCVPPRQGGWVKVVGCNMKTIPNAITLFSLL